MTTAATLVSGTLFQRGDGVSPEVFTTLGEVTSIGDFGEDNDLIEVTHMLSSAKEYIYGLADGVEFSVVVNFLADTTQDNMALDRTNKVTRNFKIVLSNGLGTFTFAALVRGVRYHLPSPNEAKRATYTLKMSGGLTGPV